ncbi:hypothetical protein FDP41_010419 [Naegleria fowleri]|uniref:Uncharacterized protein n=1 Tax=Naegleria fowleri TaxID=5763 RepID=A0A6A5C9Z7_NAEFO|nr:uncharacterized protein FDP41_010419 [Naegleria fowleri]KAF0983354.1 hypothetical protein FDP41_010419 [Naegleria fowleri]CAG4718361.1 unnamed protein product [Naegleria fowleri]
MDDLKLSFDEEYNLRVFDPAKFTTSEAVRHKSEEFATKIKDFQKLVSEVMQILESQGKTIEDEKLKAIGMRNLVKGEEDRRKNLLREYNQLIADKHTELERYVDELESLKKVEQEQRKLIDRLSNNEPTEMD